MARRLAPQFLELLELHGPAAVTEPGLLRASDPVWQLHGTGDHRVAAYTARGIEEMSADWRCAMEGPGRVVGGWAGP